MKLYEKHRLTSRDSEGVELSLHFVALSPDFFLRASDIFMCIRKRWRDDEWRFKSRDNLDERGQRKSTRSSRRVMVLESVLILG